MTTAVHGRDDGRIDLIDGDDLATLVPARGGMCVRLRARGREVFYLDESTLADPRANVRGGNPVLFPSPGRLEGDRWKHGALKQHGFARNLAWTVGSTSTANGASATLSLRSSEATRAAYPWDFELDVTYTLRARALRLDVALSCIGDSPMPFGLGFHPYFLVGQSDKARTTIQTQSTRAFDNVKKTVEPFAGFDLTAPEVDLHLLDHGSTAAVLESPSGRTVVRASPEFTHWVVWTVRGKDYVCLEPWTSPGNALNSGDRVMDLQRGQRRTFWIEIAASL